MAILWTPATDRSRNPERDREAAGRPLAYLFYTEGAVTIILVAAFPDRSAILVLAVTAYPAGQCGTSATGWCVGLPRVHGRDESARIVRSWWTLESGTVVIRLRMWNVLPGHLSPFDDRPIVGIDLQTSAAEWAAPSARAWLPSRSVPRQTTLSNRKGGHSRCLQRVRHALLIPSVARGRLRSADRARTAVAQKHRSGARRVPPCPVPNFGAYRVQPLDRKAGTDPAHRSPNKGATTRLEYRDGMQRLGLR
jgi:hypothetical protein